MNRGKDPPRSLCEKRFTLEAIKENKRLDGREVYDYRELAISLGEEPGLVEVRLGGTRVLAKVTGQVVQPKPHRPTDGQLFFNIELSPMASPAFEVGRPSSYATEITRILERCIKESRAVDTETLCIIAGEKIWEIRIDLHVLDHCGNIIDCASIAAITALKHFRHPDVTVIGEEATIHPVSERDPVPLNVHHIPLCFTFAFFLDGEYLLVDPTLSEEAVMDGRLVVGMNVHREICALQMSGGVALLPELIVRCTEIAATKCVEVTEAIKQALNGESDQTMDIDSLLHTKKAKAEVLVPEVSMDEEEREGESETEPIAQENEDNQPKITLLGEGTAELGMGGVSTWEVLDQYQWSDSEEDKATSSSKKLKPPKSAPSNAEIHVASESGPSSRIESDVIEIKSDSEEEETVVLTKEDFGGEAKTKAAATAPTSLAELVALESQKHEVSKLSEGVKELSTTGPPSDQTTVTAASSSQAGSKQSRKGRGRRGGKNSTSSVDVEVVSGATRGGARGSGGGAGGSKVKGDGQRTNSGSSNIRGRGKRRKSSTKTH